MITLVNPATGVRHQYEGKWLRPGPATDTDVRHRRAKFRGDKVYLNLPPGVQIQLDKGALQIDTDYEARTAFEATETVDAAMPKGNSSHEAWLSYAVSQGMSREEAGTLSRDQIKARFAQPAFDPDAPPELGPDVDLLDADIPVKR